MPGLIKVLNSTNGIGTTMTIEDLNGIIDELFNQARDAVDGAGVSADFQSIANVVQANNGSRTYGWLGSMPGVKKWLTSKQYEQLNEFNYVVRNSEWYNAFTLKKSEIRRNGLVDVPMLMSSLLSQHQSHKMELIIEAIVGGTSNIAFDGIAFFANAAGVRVNDNLLAGTGVTLAQVEADIQSSRAAALKFKNDKGELMRVVLDTIVCPASMEGTFKKIQTSTSSPSQSNPGVANVVGGYVKNVIVDPLLDATDVNDWYYMATSSALKPFVLQTENMNNGAEFENVMDDTKLASDGVIGYSVESASAVGYGLPQLAVKVVNT